LNFVGKFDANLPDGGLGAHLQAHVHHVESSATHVPSDAFIVPDAHLLFEGNYKRSGVDLILSNDERELVLHDYFKGEKRAALASPDGAHLTGDIVNALTGHVEYAQASGSPSAGQVIGHVTKLAGTATAIRNGVSIILNQGDNVEKGDVIQSGSSSTVGVTFMDGSVFGLSSNARMVLNEMVYDPNGSNNSSLISLVAGTISFVAGETAKHGDMKVDTPVATMGIRGTAVLVEIDFSVPGGNGTPSANFQVLVEPDGTTGSYILFDKQTLAPIATVNQAGQLLSIHDGVVSVTNSGLSPDVQKLITDVFSLKFTDNSNQNTKTATNFNDTLTPQYVPTITLADKAAATPQIVVVNTSAPPTGSGPTNNVQPIPHIDQAPTVVATSDFFKEHLGVTGITTPDTVSGTIAFVDINAGDQPTASALFHSFTYQNAQNNDITGSLTPTELAAIQAVEIPLSIIQDPANINYGTASWSYSRPDDAFDFLGAGETLTLTYYVTVNNNFLPLIHVTTVPITITITGTNDVPVITSSAPETIAFSGGTSVPGGDLAAKVPTSGTINFDDPDLTDTHTVSVALASAVLHGSTLPPTPLQIFEKALSASVGTDSTGTGHGTINWKLADLPVWVADFIPKGETLTLTYAVTVTDSQGATSTQDITVTITGTDTPAVVWIATTTTGSPPGGLWSDGTNWETGNAPTANDDVIIITDQLHGLTPSYPVTIDAAAAAKSVVMNDFGTSPPKLINDSTLTISKTFTLSADSVVDNFGTISVGLMEVQGQSVLQNSSTLTLEDGGDFTDQSSITNISTGLIEIVGGTLSVQVGITNAGQMTVDAGATLALGAAMVANTGGTITIDGTGTMTLNGATIDGGTINDYSLAAATGSIVAGDIDITGSSTISGTHLNNGQVRVESNQTLTLDGDTVIGTIFTDTASGAVIHIDDDTTLDGVTVTGGTVTDTGTVNIDATKTLKLSGVTLSGGSITNAGTIEITGTGSIENDALGNAQLTVDSGQTLTLDGTTVTGGIVTDSGTVHVNASETLKLSGVALSGGSITNAGTIEITGTGSIENDALGNNQLTVDSGQTLTLDGTTVTGGIVTDSGTIDVEATKILKLSGVTLSGGSITNAGTIEITGTGSIENDALGNAQLTIDSGQTLTLDGTTVTGGIVTDSGTVHVNAGETLKLSGVTLSGGSITNAGTIEITGTGSIENDALGNAQLTVDSGQTLTLDGTTVTGGAITDNGTVHVNAAETLKLSGVALSGGSITNAGTIEITGTGSIENDALGNAQLTIDSGQTLTLDGTTVTGGIVTDSGTLHVNATETLKLSGVALSGGSITNAGTIEIAGTGSIENDALGNAQLTVDSAQKLTLDGTTVTGGAITDNGTIDVEATKILKLNDVALSGGSITNAGTIEITGTGSIENDALGNAQLTVDSGQTLTLDGTIVTGGAVTDSGTIDVEATETLKLSGVALSGGSITNAGTIEITGTGSIENDALGNAQLTIDSGQTLTLDGTTVTGGIVTNTGATLKVEAGTTLTLQGGVAVVGGTLSDFGTVEIEGSSGATLDGVNVTGAGTIKVDIPQVPTAVPLVLEDDTTITGGKLTMGSVGTLAVKTTGGATLHDVDVTNGDSIEVFAGSVLLLDQLTTVANTGGTIAIDGTATLKLNDATITGGTINDYSQALATGSIVAGDIDITGPSTISNAGLNHGDVKVEGGQTLTLDNDTVTGTSFTASGAILQIDGGTTLKLDGVSITGGTINDYSQAAATGSIVAGDIDITGPSAISDASLNHGDVKIESGQTLTLDNDTVTGTSFTASGAIIQIDGGTTLKLDGVSIDGGTINDYSQASATGSIVAGDIDITGPSAISDASLNHGDVKIESGQTLTLDNDTVTGTSFTASGAILQIDGGTTLKLDGVSISGGTINDYSQASATGSIVAGDIDITGPSTISDASLNHGDVKVQSGQTLTLDNDTVTGTSFTASGAIIQIDGGTTLKLDGVSISGGTINDYSQAAATGSIVAGDIDITGSSTIHNASINHGDITIESDQKLTLDSSTITASTLGNSGTLDSTGTSAINQAGITNSGLIEATSGVLTIDAATTFDNNSTISAAGGTLIVDDDVSGSGSATISGGGTLEFGGADSQTVTFNGAGTLQLDAGSNFTGTVDGFVAGDVIDLANTVATTVVFDGSTLVVNGVQTSFKVSGVPAGDTFAFKSDNHGGTDLVVLPQVLTVGSSPAEGTEGTAFHLDFSDTVTGATLTSFLISGIPLGATLSDGTHSFTAGVGSTSIDVHSWDLSSLTVTPTNSANFVLSAMATAVDGNGDYFTVPTTEAVTVMPEAPTVAPVAVTGLEGTAVALDLGTTVNGLTGDSNSLASLVVSTIPDGVTLSDGTHSFTASAGSESIDIHGWNLSSLTITSVNDSNFLLHVAATTQDAEGNQSQTITATEAVTVAPEAPTVEPVAASGVEGTAIALDLGITVNGLTGDSNSLASLVVSTIPDGATLSDGTHSFKASVGSESIDIHGWNLSSLTITSANDTDFRLHVAATTQDADGNQSQTITATEAVTVTPEAPTVAPVAATGVEGSAIALDLGVTVNGLTGDSNSLASLVVSTIPDGAVLSDGTHSFTASAGSESIDIHSWNLSSLTITSATAANFTLNIAATTQDADGNLSATPTPPTEKESVTVQGPTANDVAIANASAPTGGGWSYDPENGHYYKLVVANAHWNSAQDAASHDNGAYLATITNGAEDNVVAQLVSNGAVAWVGGETTQDPPGGQPSNSAPFFWGSGPEAGTPFSYLNWSNNGNPPGNTEPNGGFDASVAGVQISSNGEWNDVPVNFNSGYSYIEEWGGLSNQVAFTENTSTELATSVLLAHDTDSFAGGSPLTITTLGIAAHGTLTLDGDLIVYHPDLDYSGSDSFTYTISDGSLTSTGTVSFNVAAAPTLEWNGSSGNWDSANWTANTAASDTIPVGADDATVSATGSAYSLMIAGADSAQMLTVDSADATVIDPGSLALTGGLAVEAGIFELHGGSLKALSIDVASGASFSGYGTITSPVAITGTIEATAHAGSALEFTGPVTGTAAFTIDDGATLQFDSSTSTGLTVSFATGNGTLVLDQSTFFQGEIAGISASGDVLDLGGLTNSGTVIPTHAGDVFETTAIYNSASNTTLLTVTDQTQGNASTFVTLVGNYSSTPWSVSVDGHGGIDVTETPTVTITVLTPSGMEFAHHDVLSDMGSGLIEGESSSSYTIVDSADNVEFVVDGNNFTYGNGGTTVTGGRLTSFEAFTADGRTALATFTGVSVDAATWMADVQQDAQGNGSALKALTGSFSYDFIGGAGNDSFGSAHHGTTGGETLTGGGGSDTFVFSLGDGATTITDFDQGNTGSFSASEGDLIGLNNFISSPTVTYVNGNTIADFGNGDVLTLLNVTKAEFAALDGTEFVNGDGSAVGPVISNAGNTVTYSGAVIPIDTSVTVSDPVARVASVNVWISSGAESGDQLTINGNLDGTIVETDGSSIHYHFDSDLTANNGQGPGIFLSSIGNTAATTADFQAAMELIQFSNTDSDPTAGGTDTSRTISWAASDNTNDSPTVTTTVQLIQPPTANGFSVAVDGNRSSYASNVIQGDSAPDGHSFTVTGAMLDGTAATFNQADGAFEVQGTYGELFIYPKAVSNVTVGGFVDASFNAGDYVFVPGSNTDNAIHHLAPGATLTDTFTYTITDAVTDVSSTATVTMTFADSNIFTGADSASWTDGNNWMFGVPASGDVAYIGSHTQVDASGAVVNGVTVDAADTTSVIAVSSKTTLHGAAINGGTINDYSIDTSGQIIAGDIDVTGSSAINNASLHHGAVTIEANQTLTLDGDVVTGTTFADTASGAIIHVDGGTTLMLSGVTVNGGTINDYSTNASGQIIAGDIDVTGLSAIDNASLHHGQVTIEANQTLTLDGDVFTGTTFADTASGAIIQVDGGATLTLSGVTINGGTINDYSTNASGQIIAGDIDFTGLSTISNASLHHGNITIESGATLKLVNDTVTGTIYIDGSTLDNTGQTLTVGSGPALGSVVLDGTIKGGTIVNEGSGIQFQGGGTLDGVTYDGALNLTAYESSVTIKDGLMVTGVNGTGSGIVNLSAGDLVFFDDSQAIDHATITLGGNYSGLVEQATYAAYQANGYHYATETLTLGANLTLDQTGSNDVLDGAVPGYYYPGLYSVDGYGYGAIVNNGTINAEGGSLTIDSSSFTDNGAITVSNGDTLHIESTTTGTGSVTIDNASTVEFSGSVAAGQTVTFAQSTGTLKLDDPADFSGKIAGISGSGDVLDLGGFDAAHDIVVASSGSYNSATNITLLVVTDQTTNHSVTLDLVGDYSGSAWTVTGDGHGGSNVVDPPAPITATIASGTSLEIASASSEDVTFQSSTGHLTLDNPSSFTGVISGFTGDGTLAGSDQIDLKGIDYHSASFTESYDAANDTLSVSDGTDSATLHFTGSYQAANFNFTTDGHGGTIVYDPPVASSHGQGVGAPTPPAVVANGQGFVFNAAPSQPTGLAHVVEAASLTTVESTLNKLSVDPSGNSIIIDNHDAFTAQSIVKAQSHAHDFHFV
jgi:hypothetical protein